MFSNKSILYIFHITLKKLQKLPKKIIMYAIINISVPIVEQSPINKDIKFNLIEMLKLIHIWQISHTVKFSPSLQQN